MLIALFLTRFLFLTPPTSLLLHQTFAPLSWLLCNQSTHLPLGSLASSHANSAQTVDHMEPATPQSTVRMEWMEFPSIQNFTNRTLADLASYGSNPCDNVPTIKTQLLGLQTPTEGNHIRLSVGVTHELIIVSYGEHGLQRCSGGDYYETDLSGPDWKSRPPIMDLGNGSYSLLLQVHPHFAGLYTLRIFLLFANYNGLQQRTQHWALQKLMLNLQIEFTSIENAESTSNLEELKQCKAEDFKRNAWSGRWTRHAFNESCQINKEGRFICLDLGEQCQTPWCWGPVGALESNGWVYSAHCSFKIFTEDEAWKCLDRKWLFFWGDSNHVDSIRNLLNFVLGFGNQTYIPRRFDSTYKHPRNESQSVRITSMFNGHGNETGNYQGLYSLSNQDFRQLLWRFFSEANAPDVMIMNSGLHDGIYWKSVKQFVEDGVQDAVRFWDSILSKIKGRRPTVIYRTTIATGGYARAFPFNPHKMEVFNHLFVEKLNEAKLISKVVDGFDLTFPWHFDNNCSDGVHYGKPPAFRNWFGQIGHQYFVDVMLVHILLNAICGGG